MSTADTTPATEVWNQRYTKENREQRTKYEPWLDDWTALLNPHKGPALDLGCGMGFDTSVLLSLGYEVTAIDFSEAALAIARRKNPAATHQLADVRHLRDLVKGPYSAVIANLSLHYFTREQTEAIFDTVGDLLCEQGLFAFRVNAYDEHGAPEDRNSWDLTFVEGIHKQFFDDKKIEQLLGTRLRCLSIKKLTTDRFGRIKSLYQVIAVKK